MNEPFFYEHIGHMQFSCLTIRALEILRRSTSNRVGYYVSWPDAENQLVAAGFSQRMARGELERFCYGFECRERYDATERQIALTELGMAYVRELGWHADRQKSQVGVILRRARRDGYWNLVVQESTFWPDTIRAAITNHKLRPGPARDFLRCMRHSELVDFLSSFVDCLTVSSKQRRSFDLQDCFQQVMSHGKYWASVGGKYSWYVFPQRYQHPDSPEDWTFHETLIRELVRPIEWGGGRLVTKRDISQSLGVQRTSRFVEAGIIRPFFSSDGQVSRFGLTAPGYLMWERRHKGPTLEFLLSRLPGQRYELSLCAASDVPTPPPPFARQPHYPSFRIQGDQGETLRQVLHLLCTHPCV